jgi:hypothetical protein
MRGVAIILMAGLSLGASLWAGGASAQLFTEANGVLMTERGAAGVDGGTLFRQDAIAAALPGMRITRSTVSGGGAATPVFLASDRGEVLLRIYGEEGGQVTMADGVSRKVYGPGRTQIGMNYARVNPSHLAHCARGEGDWSEAVFCGAREDTTLWFVFQPPPGAATGDGAATPPDALAEAELIQIRWTATPGQTQ